MFRAPLLFETTPRRRRRDAGSIYRPPPGAAPPIVPPAIVFNFYPDEPRPRHAPADEDLSAVFYHPDNNVTLLMQGQPATFAVGALTPGVTVQPVGVVLATAVGTVGHISAPLLVGEAVTFAVGALDWATTVALSGVSTTAAVGSVAVSASGGLSLSLTGQAASFAAGSIGAAQTVALQGHATTALTGLVSFAQAGSVTVLLTGQAATFSAGTISSMANYFLLPGQTATFASGFVGAGSRFGWATVVALSQTGIQGAVSVYPEGTFCFVTATYYNLVGVPFVPALVSYRVDDVASGANIVPWTSITPSTANQIAVTTAQNAMISLTRASEQHQVMFEITDDYNNVAYESVIYDLVRVPGA